MENLLLDGWSGPVFLMLILVPLAVGSTPLADSQHGGGIQLDGTLPKCEPGNYFEHATDLCQLCPPGTFQSVWARAHSCSPCSTVSIISVPAK